MNKENTEKLFTTFPNLYADKDESMMNSLVCFGFEFLDGWFQLIWELSEKLEKCILKYKEEHPENSNFPRAMQMKEKFASLRFYMTTETDEMSEYIREAEKKSEKTCEVCGNPGEIIVDRGWWMCRCPEHKVWKRPIPDPSTDPKIKKIVQELKDCIEGVINEKDDIT